MKQELVVLARKAALVAAFTVWSRSILVKLEVTIMILIVSLYYQNWYKPMMSPDVDSMESRTLLLNVLSLVATIGVVVADLNSGIVTQASATFLWAMLIAIVCGCVFVLLWLLSVLWHHKPSSASCSAKARPLLSKIECQDDDVYVAIPPSDE